MRDVCSYGITIYKKPKLNSKYPLIELEQIISGNSKCPDGEVIEIKSTSLNSRYFFERGMILYSKLRPYLDKVVYADKFGLCSSELVPFWSYINSSWLLLYLHSPKFISLVNSDSFGIKMPRVKTSTFLSAKIPIYSERFMQSTCVRLNQIMNLI